MIRVHCTREGLVGRRTATGHLIQQDSWFVALPSTKALGRIVRLYLNENDHRGLTAPVLDVGPWNEHDEDYVFNGQRPMAESGLDERGRATNGSGIDLSDAVFHALGLSNNGDIEWEFVDPLSVGPA